MTPRGLVDRHVLGALVEPRLLEMRQVGAERFFDVVERDSCRAVPAACPVQRSIRLLMSFSTLAAGIPP